MHGGRSGGNGTNTFTNQTDMRNFSPLFEAAAAGVAGVLDAAGATGAAATSTTGAAATGAVATAAQTAATTPTGHWSSFWLKPDGTIDHTAFARAPEQLRGLADGELKNSKDIEGVLTKMQHLATLAGKKGLAPLPADAKPEVVAERNVLLRSINGVPEKPEDYGITKPADLPDAAWSADAAKSFVAIAHKHNVSPAAVKEIIAEQAKLAMAGVGAQETASKEYFAGQEQAFKDALNKEGVPYDKALDLATRAAKTFGIDPAGSEFAHASVRLMLHKVAVALGEPRLVTGATGDASGGLGDRAKAEAIIHDKTNPEFAIYWDAAHPQNNAVKQKVMQWMAAAATAEQQQRLAAGGRR